MSSLCSSYRDLKLRQESPGCMEVCFSFLVLIMPLSLLCYCLIWRQILALVLRPKKDAKLRKYWNLYHGWVGRIALILAVANIFVGMHIATAKHSLRVGYPVILTMELLAIVILESILWFRRRKQATWNSFAVEAKPDAFSYGGAV